MSRTFFATELETVTTWWRVMRRDGVTLGFTAHDRDLWFDGVLHRAAPGMLPSAIRLTAGLELDSAEVSGALTHESISAPDLAAGRFDGAGVEIGLVDWESLERAALYRGTVGEVTEDAGRFDAELRSAKAELERDVVPRTSPTCRAEFCGPGCHLSVARFTHEATLAEMDAESGELCFAGIGAGATAAFDGGTLRWLDGPLPGLTLDIAGAAGDRLGVEGGADAIIPAGTRALLREGCDHTFATCRSRFANSVNFQGEPFLPGNDLLARYPTAGA
ncbi:conserved hypothetical protein [Altererythrobacter sp. B11]|uniref:DUF2163 domain-containing protein n=1 Tax=Altererythrobacter sp. B11 TaxID=2060312 RepID=UPI000DC70A8D|nr:DUF2163 domain-containing protein [Altererythrobacter sp. B11]BBC71592.1 conserved hypothetical protein [Altererythrobacter sp. B11]